MILLINICVEKLHYFEFIKPVEDILKKEGIEYLTKKSSRISKQDLDIADGIIICGTSLKDNNFLKNIAQFSWVRKTAKPVLGICAGMHIIGSLFGGELKRETEIGFYDEFFNNFLGLDRSEQVYHLHNNYIDFSNLNEFEVCSEGNIPQAVKHKEKPLYGVLFHPEVRQKSLINEFIKIYK